MTCSAADRPAAGSKTRLVMELLRPYRGWLLIVLGSILVQTAMSIAAPWPLKIVRDHVVGSHQAPGWLELLPSVNLAPGNFYSRRDLAIEVHDEEVVKRLHHVVHHDWENSRPLDLSDEGLLADLEDKDPDVAEELALEGKSGNHHAHESKSGSRFLPVLPLVISVAFFLVADIDSPRRGVIRVVPHNLLSLPQSLRAH